MKFLRWLRNLIPWGKKDDLEGFNIADYRDVMVYDENDKLIRIADMTLEQILAQYSEIKDEVLKKCLDRELKDRGEKSS